MTIMNTIDHIYDHMNRLKRKKTQMVFLKQYRNNHRIHHRHYDYFEKQLKICFQMKSIYAKRVVVYMMK